MLVRMDKAQVAQTLLLDPVNEAMSLVRRYKEGKGFRGYVRERMKFLVPIGALMFVISVGCAAATVLYLGGTRPILVLFAILLVPFVLIGSFFVQAYTFAAWLENRALSKALHRKPPVTRGIDLGTLPPVPWLLAALFLGLPLLMLFAVVPGVALALILLLVAAPVAFARLDR